MTKGPIISIVLVLGIVVLGATAAILFVLNPASRGEAADQSQRAATSKSDAPILSEKASPSAVSFEHRGSTVPAYLMARRAEMIRAGN
jgi:hypothetical protein